MVREFKTVIGKMPDTPEGEASCLVVISGNNLGKVYPLKHSPLLLGRSEESDIVSDDPLTSRKHAQIFIEGNSVFVLDLESTNGIYVNFNRVTRSLLSNGDKLSIGQTIFKYLDTDSIETTYHDELYQLASMDGLTQIYNRKKFMELLEKAMRGARQGDEHLTLCIMDLDFFKKINDTYGHQAGDYALRCLANIVKKVVRREDIFARYGGEEFCLLLLNRGIEEGRRIAEKVRIAIEEAVFEFENHTFDVTVSVGVTAFETTLTDGDSFIAKADAKMYEAKEGGRNCIR